MKTLFLKTNSTDAQRNEAERDLQSSLTLPRMIELAWVYTNNGESVEAKNYIVEPHGFDIPFEAECCYNITTRDAHENGVAMLPILIRLMPTLLKCDTIIGCGLSFDVRVLAAEMFRLDLGNIERILIHKPMIDIAAQAKSKLCLPGVKPNDPPPMLHNLYHFMKGETITWENDLLSDVKAIRAIYEKMDRNGLINKNILPGAERLETIQNPGLG